MSILRDLNFYFLTVCVGVLEVVIILVETRILEFFISFWFSDFRFLRNNPIDFETTGDVQDVHPGDGVL